MNSLGPFSAPSQLHEIKTEVTEFSDEQRQELEHLLLQQQLFSQQQQQQQQQLQLHMQSLIPNLQTIPTSNDVKTEETETPFNESILPNTTLLRNINETQPALGLEENDQSEERNQMNINALTQQRQIQMEGQPNSMVPMGDVGSLALSNMSLEMLAAQLAQSQFGSAMMMGGPSSAGLPLQMAGQMSMSPFGMSSFPGLASFGISPNQAIAGMGGIPVPGMVSFGGMPGGGGMLPTFPTGLPPFGMLQHALVPQELLDWDEYHRFNRQGRYCYCRKDMKPSEPALQCVLCKDWFHPGCMAKLERTIFHGEYRHFTFSCSICNSGIEVLKEHCRNWVQTGQIALLHLIITKKQIWFKMREIADFLDQHWEELCERHHTRHPRWVCILGNAFSFRKDHTLSRHTNTPFNFLRSEDLGLIKGYWTFKDLDTQFPELRGMELHDNLKTTDRHHPRPSINSEVKRKKKPRPEGEEGAEGDPSKTTNKRTRKPSSKTEQASQQQQQSSSSALSTQAIDVTSSQIPPSLTTSNILLEGIASALQDNPLIPALNDPNLLNHTSLMSNPLLSSLLPIPTS